MSHHEQDTGFYERVIKATDWELNLVKKKPQADLRNPTPAQKYIALEAFNGENSADEIYFSGEHPFIHIKQLRNLDKGKIRQMHSKIWNEGRSPFLAVITPTELVLYNCYELPVEHNDDVDRKLQIDRFKDLETDLERLKQCLHQSKIDSGEIWNEELGKNLNTKNRVDKKLLDNLKDTRKILYDSGNGLSLPVVHDLLGRALFIFYLEDRNILTTDAYPSKPQEVRNFYDLLDYPEQTYKLFDKLKEKFNGDLFPVSDKERKGVKVRHLQLVKDCFYGHQSTGQRALWKMFRFDYIPIELISSIYEEFMSQEGLEKGELTIRDKGAYYTKPMLVEFMLNEVLPWPDANNYRYDYKILDPACGSGIFLVESYKRLIARWKYSNKKSRIDETSLKEILLNSIYGIDKETEAIKVAAFSLYLTFLNYLEPVEIKNDYLEHKRKKFDPLIRWTDANELNQRKDKKAGNNLFQNNTFAESDITKLKFDIIVGNPPWKKDNPEPVVAAYIKDHKLPAQIVCAYLDYMPSMLAEGGIIALVSAAKGLLFNTGGKYENFRQKLFRENEVETVINLAVVRDIMFDNASAPGAVIIYRKPSSNKKKPDHIVYCVPKSIETIDNTQAIVIDATEVKYLPLKEVLGKNSKIFKIAMWGNMRDYLLIKRLTEIPSIAGISNDQEKGTGLHKRSAEGQPADVSLKDYKLIPIDKIQRYYTPRRGLLNLGDKYSYYRKSNIEIFKHPIVLLKRGSIDGEFSVSYADYDCVFTDRVYGLSIKDKTKNYHKALVACLNSSIATYYLFLISSTWAVDKQGDTIHEEILSFPAITEQMSESAINLLADKVDELAAIIKGENFALESTHNEAIKNIEKQIDKIIYEELCFTKFERNLIKDLLNNSSGLPGYKITGAEKPVSAQSLVDYAEKLAEALTKTLKVTGKGVTVEVLKTGKKQSLNTVLIHFNAKSDRQLVEETKIEDRKFGKLIEEINTYVYEQHSESVYYRKVFKYYKKDKIYLLKPNEKRFWTVSQALNDADSIIAELITANNK